MSYFNPSTDLDEFVFLSQGVPGGRFGDLCGVIPVCGAYGGNGYGFGVGFKGFGEGSPYENRLGDGIGDGFGFRNGEGWGDGHAYGDGCGSGVWG
jgi:hypothetical protein